MTEHIKQGLSENNVQSTVDGTEKPKKKRSPIAKRGINRWNQDLLKRVLDTQERIECELRWVRHKLDHIGEADYSKEDLELYAVPDSVDREILQRLLEVGVDGALPKDLAAEVNRRGGYCLKYYDVARRLVRLNKRLHKETGKLLAEKRGKHWALTRLAFEAYDSNLVDEPVTVEVAEVLDD